MALVGQGGGVKAEQRFAYGHVDKHGLCHLVGSLYQGLVHQAVAIPALLVVCRLRQCDGLAHKAPEGVGLWQSLTVELVYPLLRAVGGNDYYGLVLIVGLGHCRCHVEQGRTACHAHSHRIVSGLCHA